MGLFKDRWDSENYPSSEDYMEAKRSGTLKNYRQFNRTLSSSEKKAKMSKDAMYPTEGPHSSLEAQTASIESKSRAANAENKKNDAKRYRNTDSKYGEPKPFAGKIPNPSLDKKKQFKGLAILIAIVIGVLPSFGKLMDSISDELNLSTWFESLNGETSDSESTSAVTEAVELNSNITTALPADHLVIFPSSQNDLQSSNRLVDNIASGQSAAVLYGNTSEGIPFVEVQLKNGSVFPLSYSNFMNASEKSTYFNEQGSLLDTAYMEVVFTDLTNDNLKEMLCYYYVEGQNTTIEIFYNTGRTDEPYKALNFFESYDTLNITDKGILQRIDDTGALYDEIEVTEEGVYLVEE